MTPAVGVPFSMVKIIGYGTTASSPPTNNHQNQGSDQHQHLSKLPTSMAKCEANKKRNEHLEKIGGTCQTKIGIETSKMHAPLLQNDHFWVSQLEAQKSHGLLSGKHLHNYGKSPFFMGKSTISMAIFYVANC